MKSNIVRAAIIPEKTQPLWKAVKAEDSTELKDNLQKAIEGGSLKVKEANFLLQKILTALIVDDNTGDEVIILCPIIFNSNTIELMVHTSCYWALDFLCVKRSTHYDTSRSNVCHHFVIPYRVHYHRTL